MAASSMYFTTIMIFFYGSIRKFTDRVFLRVFIRGVLSRQNIWHFGERRSATRVIITLSILTFGSVCVDVDWSMEFGVPYFRLQCSILKVFCWGLFPSINNNDILLTTSNVLSKNPLDDPSFYSKSCTPT